MFEKLYNKMRIAQNPRYKLELADKTIELSGNSNDFFTSNYLMNALTVKSTAQMDLGLYSDAIETFDQILKINNQSLTEFLVYKGKGSCFNELNMYQEAIECFKKCCELQSDFNIYLIMADIYEKLNQTDEAIEIYEMILEHDSQFELAKVKVEDLKNNSLECSNIEECIRKGEVYFANKEFNNSLEIFEHILEVKQDSIVVYNYLGIINEELGKPEVALEYYKKALEIDDNDFAIYRNMGNLYAKAEDCVNANRYYEKSLSINPNDLSTLGHNADCLLKLKNYKDAMDYSIRALKINPQFIPAYFTIAGCYEGIDEFEKAIMTYDQILNVYPHAKALISKSLALKQLKRYDESFECLKHAVEFDGKTDEIIKYCNELEKDRVN